MRWLMDLLRDGRLALRGLGRQVGFTTVAVLTLALGVGANSAMFSIANPMLVEPLPYPEAGRLMAISLARRDRPAQSTHVSYAAFRDWQQGAHAWTALAAYATAGSTYRSARGTAVVVSTAVTGDLFRVLESPAARGRVLAAADDVQGAPAVVVVSDAFWRTELDGRADVLGQPITLDGAVYSIVGVMPPSFTFPHASPSTDLWIPVTHYQPFAALLPVRAAPFLDVVGRLGPRATPEGAQAEITAVVGALARAYPATDQATVATVLSFQQAVLGETRPTLVLLVGAVGLLLLIACANVASLQLTRTASRVRELAVRVALGATRGRLVRQVLVESLVLALVGGTIGVFVAEGCLALLRNLLGSDLPPVRAIGVDRAVLAFTFGVATVTGLVFGAFPALVATGEDLQQQVKAGGGRGATADRRRSRAHGLLVVGEIALALVLLTDAGLLIRSLERLHAVRTGFVATNVWAATITLPQGEYPAPASWRAFASDFRSRLAALPAIETVGVGVGVPLTAPAVAVPIAVAGQPVNPSSARPTADLVEADPTYFRALGIPLSRGRAFAESDTESAPPVAVVNQTFVRRFLAAHDPIGQHVTLGGSAAPLEVVGVVSDTAQTSLVEAPPPVVYVAFAQRPFWVMTFAVRTRAGGLPMANVVQSALGAFAPNATVVSVDALGSLVDRVEAPSTHRTLVLGLLGALALVLAGVGIYGLSAYAVARRTQEVGVRLALGADPAGLRRRVLFEGVRLAMVGIAIGVVLTWVTTPLLSALLFQVTATDPLTRIAVPVLLALTALVACYVPARRATRVDPLVALRSE